MRTTRGAEPLTDRFSECMVDQPSSAAPRAVPVRRDTPATVLLLHHGENWIRGSERCLLDLVEHVDRARFTPVVLCNAPVLADAARALGAPAYVSPGWDESGDRLLPSRPRVAEMRRIVAEHDVRLAHANSPMPIKALLPVARAAGIPVVAHLHLLHPPATRLYSGLHQVALAVGVSETAVAGLRHDGMPADRLRVIYNGIDARRLRTGDAGALRATLGIGADDVALAAVGSLIHRKGVDVLVAAMRVLAARDARYHLVLLGDGGERSALERTVREAALADRVHFLGERPDVGAVLRGVADIGVSAAREEAFPLNLLEAALCGLPLVVSDIAAHREAVVAGETGVLVPGEDPAAFADAVVALAADPERRRAMGMRGQRRIETAYLVEHYVASFERTYGELLDRPRARYGWLRGSAWPPVYTRWLREAVGRRLGAGRGAARSATP